MEYHEVAIVGGGPAGSSCASELAKNGVDTILFDHSHPREKPCGGAITQRIFEDFEIPKNVIEKYVDWLILESPSGHRVEIHSDNLGIVVMRKKFDYFLFSQAKKLIETVEEKVIDVKKDGIYWHIKTTGNNFKAKILIGADGCPSLIRGKVFKPIPKEFLGQTFGYHIPHKKEHINKKFKNSLELYLIGKPYLERGYVWIFPKSDCITVGIGSKLGTSQLKERLHLFLNKNPSAKRIIFPEKIKPHSHLVPFISDSSFFTERSSGKNWILIGDAAGHVNPITAEGIYYAMKGGKLAAKAIVNGNLEYYEKLWRADFGPDLFYGAKLQNLFYNTFFLDRVIRLSQKSKEIQDIITDIIASRVSYDKLFKRKIFLNLPSIIVKSLFY